MRVRTEAKRQAILHAAAIAFRELGVVGTTMSEVASRVGCSKATLYGYFPSKEGLVLEILLAQGAQQGDAAFGELAANPDLGHGLANFGTAFLDFLTMADTVAITRLAVSEGGRSDLGRKFYELGPHTFLSKLSAYLHAESETGRLVDAAPDTMALHLSALLKCEVFDQTLFGVEWNHRGDSRAIAERAVTAFLKIYGDTNTGSGPAPLRQSSM